METDLAGDMAEALLPAFHAADARVTQTVAHDADAQARSLRGWRQTYDQLGAGAFTGMLTELALGQVTLFRESTSHALRQTCEVQSDAYWFGLAPGRQGCGKVDAQVIGDDAFALRPGRVEFELVTPTAYEFFGVVVNGGALMRHAREVEHLDLADADANALWRAQVIQTDAAHKQQLCATLRQILDNALISRSALADHARANLQAALLAALVELCVASRPVPSPAPTSRQKRRRIVSEARAYVLANRERPVGVPELCKRLYVSRRTLQYCFEDVLGMSPVTCLRAVRLNGARRDLSSAARCASGAGRSRGVQDIAAAWGFWHLGQFAADYGRLFGQKPSETLRQAWRG